MNNPEHTILLIAITVGDTHYYLYADGLIVVYRGCTEQHYGVFGQRDERHYFS